MAYLSLKGFRDILPTESARLSAVEATLRQVAKRYRFGELRLPMMEVTELFTRGVGEETDVVGKEMYTFNDRSDPPVSMTLRPELTAGAVRAWIEKKVGKVQNLTRWFYLGPAFRYEQPQAGRFRQFSTFGVELIGSARPEAEAEVIAMGCDLLSDLGITRYQVEINSLGTAEEREAYRKALVRFLEERANKLSPESQIRLKTNPMRVLDSKDEADQAAIVGLPTIDTYLGEESQEHFKRVCQLLEQAGVSFSVNPKLVRGLDYYSRTVFEFLGDDLGAQNALGGGGRYDRLIETLGGKPTPAVGFGFGIERLVMAAGDQFLIPADNLDIYIIALDEDARTWAVGAAAELRGAGRTVMTDLLGRSFKAQMREANRLGASSVAIVGATELASKRLQLKDMESGDQREVQFDKLVELVAIDQTKGE